jgi:hypothetical protein
MMLEDVTGVQERQRKMFLTVMLKERGYAETSVVVHIIKNFTNKQ